MRILIMDTGRGTNRATIDLWRERLALDADDTMSLLTWQPPAEPLPVTDHLVFGPRFEPTRREPRRSETRFHIFDDADISGEDMQADSGAPDDDDADDASLGDIELSEQMSEQLTDRSERRTLEQGMAEDIQSINGNGAIDGMPGASPTRRLTHLPWNHPDRLRQAARWRLNRARRGARGVARRGKGYLKRNQSVPARLAMRAVGLRGDGVATSFALSVMRSNDAADVFRSADVVVPVDSRSQRAAWVLAQKIEGPDVVVTYPAAARVVAARRQGGPGSRG